MTKEILNPPQWKPPRGYSHLVKTTGGSALYVAGQASFDADGRIVGPGDFCRQYEKTHENLAAVLQTAGAAMTDIVKMTVYCTDRDNFFKHGKACAGIYKGFFGDYFPAVTLLEVKRLFLDEMLIEIDAIAHVECV